MNPEWKSFIMRNGAVLDGDVVAHFGDVADERTALASANLLIDLSGLSLIRARGPDAASFLQGQLSNDIEGVSESRSQLTSYANPKGRMLAVLWVFRRGDDYMLQLPAPLAEATLKRLRMFVLRAKVMLDSADAQLCSFGVAGAQADELLARHVAAIPEEIDGCLTHAELTVLRLPAYQPRYAVIAPPHAATALWERLARDCTRTGPWAWRWLDIMGGLPTVFSQTAEAFVPQMANLDLVGGVSFRKGCYPGQEIVARMQYLGRLKQRMYRGHVRAAPGPQPGDSLYAPDFGDQSAGTIVDAQPSPEDGYDLLAVIQITSAETGTVHLWRADGPVIEIRPLPYAIPPVDERT